MHDLRHFAVGAVQRVVQVGQPLRAEGAQLTRAGGAASTLAGPDSACVHVWTARGQLRWPPLALPTLFLQTGSRWLRARQAGWPARVPLECPLGSPALAI